MSRRCSHRTEIYFQAEYPALIKIFHGGVSNHRELEELFYMLFYSGQ